MSVAPLSTAHVMETEEVTYKNPHANVITCFCIDTCTYKMLS